MVPTEWERQPGEPSRWYDRFVRYYLRAEGERTLLGAYRRWLSVERPETARKSPITGAPGSWKKHFEEWRWKERAEEYDVELRRLDGVQWEKHRKEVRDRSWNASGRLWDKVNAMLAFPVSEQQVEQDGQSITISPARWTFRDAASVAETADRLGRLAVGLPTEYTEAKVEGEVAVTHEDGGKTPWWEVLDEAGLDAAIGRMERADAPPQDTGDDDDDWDEAAAPGTGDAGPDDEGEE